MKRFKIVKFIFPLLKIFGFRFEFKRLLTEPTIECYLVFPSIFKKTKYISWCIRESNIIALKK